MSQKDPISIFFKAKKDDPNWAEIQALQIQQDGTVEQLIFSKINFVASLMLSAMATIAVAVIIYAGFLYIFSVGNDELRGKASRALTYVIVAIVVASLAYGVTNLVIQLASKVVA